MNGLAKALRPAAAVASAAAVSAGQPSVQARAPAQVSAGGPAEACSKRHNEANGAARVTRVGEHRFGRWRALQRLLAAVTLL